MTRAKSLAALLTLAAGLALASPARAQLILVKQSTGYTFTLPDVIAASDHVSGLTGQTGTVYLARVTGTSGAITKAASTNNVAEIDSVNAPGQYTLALTAAETGALGYIKGYYKAATSDPVSFTVKVVAYDPDSSTNLGLTNLDATVSSRNTGAVTLAAGQNVATLGGLAPPANFNALGITAGGKVSGVVLADTLTTYTGNTPQTGDAFARLGAPVGASISADVQTRSTYAGGAVASVTGNVGGNVVGSVGSVTAPVVSTSVTNPVTVGTNTDKLGYSLATPPPTSATIAAAVRDVDNTAPAASSLGAKVNSAASAGDPWATSLPGAYASGTAGNLLGNRLDAAVSSRLATAGYTAPPTVAQIATATWQDLVAGSDFATTGSAGALLRTLTPAPTDYQQRGVAVTLPTGTGTGQILLAAGQVTATNGGGGGASFIPAGTVVAGSTPSSVTVSGLAASRNFVGQHLYHQSGESRLIGAQSAAGGNYTFTFTATALLPASFSAINAGETVKPTP